MTFCSLRPVLIEDTDITVQHVYIVHEVESEKCLKEMHDWMINNYPNHEELSFGKQYVMADTSDFVMAFKLTWT